MGGIGGFFHNLKKDAEGIVDPRNYVKAGSQLIHHPLGFAENMGKSYLNIAEHPLRNLENNPLSTLLAVAPVAGGVGALAKVARAGEVSRLATLRAGLADEALQFNTLRPNNGLVHVLAKKGAQDAGHITMYPNGDGTFTVQMIRVPEALRRQGIGTQLFNHGEAAVGGAGKLLHQADPSLLSPEGSAFKASFRPPQPRAADVRAGMREALQGTGPGKAYGQKLGPRFTPEELAAYLQEQRDLRK